MEDDDLKQSDHVGPPTRTEHLRQCRARALELVERGELKAAWQTITHDLLLHPETRHSADIALGSDLLAHGDLDTPRKMTAFINSICEPAGRDSRTGRE